MSDLNVTFEFGQTVASFDRSRIRADYIWEAGGQDVDPLAGTAAARPWYVDVVDYSTAVTSVLADSSGRTQAIGQIGKLRVDHSTSPPTGEALAYGRISDVLLNEDQSWRFVMEDELLRARNSLIFTETSSCQLYPPGLSTDWGIFKGRGGVPGRLISTAGNLSEVQIFMPAPISREIVDEIRNDFEGRYANNDASTGNFRYLRLNTTAGDLPVFAFGGGPEVILNKNFLTMFDQDPESIRELRVWVVTPAGELGSPSTADDGLPLDDLILYMPGAPPSPTRPLHIASTVAPFGIHPVQLVKDIFDGDYGDVTVAYDSATTTSLIDDQTLPRRFFRITEPQPMIPWLEDNIFKPYGILPFWDAVDGEVRLASIFLPTSDAQASTSLYEFTSTNLREAPTWIQTKKSLVTSIRTSVDRVSQLTDARARLKGYSFAADMLEVNTFTTEIVHDRSSTQLGRHVQELYLGCQAGAGAGSEYHERLTREKFDRFGDGAIWGQLHVMSSDASTGVAAVKPGDFVKVSLGLYPNMGIQGRGGTRIVQVMSRTETPFGPILDYCDAAEDPATITAPTLTAAVSTNNPKHALSVTIGGLSTATSSGPAAGWEVEVGQSASTLAVNSTAWVLRSAVRQSRSSDPWYISSGTFDITELESGSTYFVRARFGLYKGYHSAWTYTTSGIETSELPGPSGLSATAHTLSSIDFIWTNATGSTGYDLEVRHSTFGGTLVRDDVLAPGYTRYRLTGLTSGTTYTFDVRYLDPYGGVSPSTSMSTETTGSSTQCPPLQSFYVVFGVTSTNQSFPMY